MRTDVTLDVNWEGRETEDGNIIYGWHLGTVCLTETLTQDGMRYDTYVSHPQSDDATPVILYWTSTSDRAEAQRRHDALVAQLREAGEHGLFARRFDTTWP